MPCAEPYRVDVSMLENGAGAPFAEYNLVCGRERARQKFSETRRNQEEDSAEFPEEDSGIKKGMTDLLLRGGGRANFPPGAAKFANENVISSYWLPARGLCRADYERKMTSRLISIGEITSTGGR
jgi:hypothetical protein